MQDKYGESSLVTVERYLDAGVISTGSLSLDVSLGIGGIPRGVFTEIVGPESIGKTTIALSLAKHALDQGVNVLYLDAERTLDLQYARAIIGDFDDDTLTIASPETAEEIFEVAEEGIVSGAFGVIILDSLGALAPEKELEDDLVDANVALLARLLTKWLRRNSFKVKRHNVAFIFLNQVRDNIGSYIRSYVSPGGNALKHFLTIRIKLTSGVKITGKERDDIKGIFPKYTVTKNKLASPYRSGVLPIIFGHGIDYYRDVIEFSKRLGILRQSGSYYKFEGETLGQGVEKTIGFLKNNPDTLDKIVKMCYAILEE
jgi:recombination protein RecA